jgi:hypothetical protein
VLQLLVEKIQLGGTLMLTTVISYKNKPIPVHNYIGEIRALQPLQRKLEQMELDFEFRKKLRRISLIELIGDVAIFKYSD